MRIGTILTADVICTSSKGEIKEEIIKELLNMLVKANLVLNKEQAFDDLMKREAKMSTGIQHGVAIPHAKTTAVKRLVACVGLKKEGLDFDSLDGQKSTIFIMTLSPIDRVGPHVQFLAEISKVIRTEEARKQLLQAKEAQEVLAVFGL